MPGHLWILVGILLLLLSIVLVWNVIMPSLTIFSPGSASFDTIKRPADESERKCKSLNYLNAEICDVGITKVQTSPLEGGTEGLENKENDTTVVHNLKSNLNNGNDIHDVQHLNDTTPIIVNKSEAQCLLKDGQSNIKLQSITDLDGGVELRIARLETLPVRSNDCKMIKVAKVIRTQNLLGLSDFTGSDVETVDENMNSALPAYKSDFNETSTDGLVPNFIIGDKLYNYDLSLKKDVNVTLDEMVCVETEATDTAADTLPCDGDLPFVDLNELKRKKRRKRNKCMEIFNVPSEILNRIEEEESPVVNGNDLAGPKIQHVPCSELVNLDSDPNQVSGEPEAKPQSIGPSSMDQFSWVFNHQFTMDSIPVPSQSFPNVYITNNATGDHEGTVLGHEKTFDSFNKPVKKELDALGLTSNQSCENHSVKREEIGTANSISKSTSPLLKKSNLINIKSKLKEVKIEKPNFSNRILVKPKAADHNIRLRSNNEIVEKKSRSNSLLGVSVDSTQALYTDCTAIDKCCSSESHLDCSLSLNGTEFPNSQSSLVEAPDHFHFENESRMQNPTFDLNDGSEVQLRRNPRGSCDVQHSPSHFFSGNEKAMNDEHSQKSISDLDFLIGSFYPESKESRDLQSHSLSGLYSANTDVTDDVNMNHSGNHEENALKSLDELCIKSLETIKCDPLSLTSNKNKRVTFVHDVNASASEPVEAEEQPIEQTITSIMSEPDDECDKESDTLVEDDAISLSSSTSSLTSSSSESSGQSMIFNGIATEKAEEVTKLDAMVLKHTSVAHALNQHNFHNYLSPIKELSLEANGEDCLIQNDTHIGTYNKHVIDRICSKIDAGNAIKLNECVTSFCDEDYSEENSTDCIEEARLVVAKVNKVEREETQCVLVGNTAAPIANETDFVDNTEVPITPVVLNSTKFDMADLNNGSSTSSVSKQDNGESDDVETCSARRKTNSSGSELSSELEHILSSIEYESSQSGSSRGSHGKRSSESCSSGSSSELNTLDENFKETRKLSRSSSLPLDQDTKENLNESSGDNSPKYRLMVLEKVKNFENITCHQDQPSPKKSTTSKLREPVIKAKSVVKDLIVNSVIENNEAFAKKAPAVSDSADLEKPRTLKKVVHVPKVSEKVKTFEQNLFERENSKSPSPEPIDFKNIFSEKISNFENLVKKSKIGVISKTTPNIDVKINISEKLQSFENLSSSSRESSESPELSVRSSDSKQKSYTAVENAKTKTATRSLRSSYEEKLKNYQLYSNKETTLDSCTNSTAKKQHDVLNKVSNFESQIKTNNKPLQKDISHSKIPKMKTKSLESIFTSQQIKASDRSSSVDDICNAKNSPPKKRSAIAKLQVPKQNSHVKECEKLKLSPPMSKAHSCLTPINSLDEISSYDRLTGPIEIVEGISERVGKLYKPCQNENLSKSNVSNNHAMPNLNQETLDRVEYEIVHETKGDPKDEIDNIIVQNKTWKDIMNDSGITEDFEDGLKINTNVTHAVMEKLSSDSNHELMDKEATVKLSMPNSHDVIQRIKPGTSNRDLDTRCHTTERDVSDNYLFIVSFDNFISFSYSGIIMFDYCALSNISLSKFVHYATNYFLYCRNSLLSKVTCALLYFLVIQDILGSIF